MITSSKNYNHPSCTYNIKFLLLLTTLMTAFTAEMPKARNPIDDIELDGAHFQGGFCSSCGIKSNGCEVLVPIRDCLTSLENLK